MSQNLQTAKEKNKLHFIPRSLPINDEAFMKNMPHTKIKHIWQWVVRISDTKFHLNPSAVLVLMYARFQD